jgi:hypothetical protein
MFVIKYWGEYMRNITKMKEKMDRGNLIMRNSINYTGGPRQHSG